MKTTVKFFLLIMIILTFATLQFFDSVLFDQNVMLNYENVLPYFNAQRFQDLWAIMYIYIGIIFWVILINKRRPLCKYAIGSFAIMVLISIIWSYVFFNYASVMLGCIVMVAYLISTLFTFFYFARINLIATVFFVAYIGWVILISYMNIIAFLVEQNMIAV